MKKSLLEHSVSLLSRLPLSALYVLGDGLVYPTAYYLVRYRRTITRRNLQNAFPELPSDRIKDIERRFYHHFTDTIMEIIYGYHISDAELRERFTFDNIEAVEQAAQRAGGVIFMLGHVGNWEWIADIAKRYKDPSIIHYNVYRRLKNHHMDALMLHLREKRGGGGAIDKNILLRQLIRIRNNPNPITLGLISDQKPNPCSSHIWLDFLHQDTAFLNGGEVLAHKFGYAVFYVHIQSNRRGYYQARFDSIYLGSDTSQDIQSKVEEGDITRLFATHLEQNIILQPELWLWSHNRWKWHRS